MRKLAALLIVALALLFFLHDPEERGIPLVDWIREPERSARRNEAIVERELEGAREVRPEGSPTVLEPARTETGDAGPPPGLELASAAPADTPAGLAGRVRTLEGRPVAGLELSALDPLLVPLATQSDAEGRFALPPVQPGSELRVDSPGWMLLGGDARSGALGALHDLVVAERLDLDGRVTDADGAPLAGAEVLGWTPLAAAAAPELGVSLPSRFSASATTGSDGVFSLHGLPRVPYTRLEVRKDGYSRLRLEAPMQSTREMVLVLERGVRDG